jgi:hypothetical protein
VDGRRFIEWHYGAGFESAQEARVYSEFIHEYTHHWCFASLVSRATALLDFRIRLFADIAPEARPLWARDYLVSQATQKMFRPLAEGMAQFAEFDTWNSGRWHPFASPISAAELCFAVPGDSLISESLLSIMRKSDYILGRKASLYLKPFEIDEGYLPGYMVVKQWHQILCFKKPDLTQELFLAFIRHYFWNDATLASTLLSQDLHAPNVVQSIVTRLRQRVVFLLTDDSVPERIAKYEKKAQGKHDFYEHEMALAENETDECVAKLNQYAGHTIDIVAKLADQIMAKCGVTREWLGRFVYSRLGVQSHIIVATESVGLEIDGEQWWMTIDGANLARTKITFLQHSGAPPAVGSHRLVAVMSTFTSYLLFALVADNGALHFIHRESSADRVIDYAKVYEFIVAQKEQNEFSISLASIFESQGMAVLSSNAMSSALAATNDMVLSFYSDAMLMTIAHPADRDYLRRLVMDSGVRSFFEEDPVRLRLFASYSLLNNAYARFFELANFTRMFGDTDLTDAEQSEFIKKITDQRGSEVLISTFDDQCLIKI